MRFDPVTSEQSAADKAGEVLIAVGWLAFFVLLSVAPVVIWAVWRALL